MNYQFEVFVFRSVELIHEDYMGTDFLGLPDLIKKKKNSNHVPYSDW